MQDLHAVQGTAFDIVDIAREMRAQEAYARDGHTARTLVREADLRVVLMVLNTGSIIKEHRVAETAVVHSLEGHVRLRLPDKVADLPSGRLLVLESDLQHSVEALEESTLLLTIGWRAKS
jgi:quercetin dioxygenase-like cupin family protein